MLKLHYGHWPNIPTSLTVPETSLYDNLRISAMRYPEQTAIQYYGSSITYSELDKQVNAMAGYLQHLGVTKGENVLLFMQNSPQFVISYYAIIRADAVVVPVNPMLKADELAFYIKDAEIRIGFAGQELYEQVQPLLERTPLQEVVVSAYSDYAGNLPEGMIPPEVKAGRSNLESSGVHIWSKAVAAGMTPGPHTAKPGNLAVLPYTSGTTGIPKGCMHTHRTVMANTVGAYHWCSSTANSTHLATLPLFHVTGMVHSMHMPIFGGSPIVLLTRWNREAAVELIKHGQCSHWVAIATMVVDFLGNPALRKEDIASLKSISGGGAALPEAVGEKLYELTGLKFVEGYGLSETIAQTHFNPPNRPKMQCLGIPSYDVDARIIDPATMKELGVGEIGEIIVSGPQIMEGYYKRDDDNRQSFFELDGKRFFRTGDIGRYDDEGYFFIVDRVKRMINAAGYKVWPTEVESFLYKHPAVQQACVVGVPDERRGETVKAFVILNEADKGGISEAEIIQWAKEHMAAYKYPRMVEFRDEFPMTSSGKILWRKLQEEEKERAEKV